MGVLLLLSLIVVGLKEFFLNCLCIKNLKCNFNYFLWHHSIIYAVFRSHFCKDLSISIEWTKRLLFKTEFFHCWTLNTFNLWLSKIRQKLFFLALTSKHLVRNFVIHRKHMQVLIKSLLHKLQMFSVTNFISNKRWYVEIENEFFLGKNTKILISRYLNLMHSGILKYRKCEATNKNQWQQLWNNPI